MRKLLENIPLALVLTRLGLAPVVLLLAIAHPAPAAFAICLVVAILSDYFDGAVARKLGVATPWLRRMDSIVDSVFYVCVAAAIVVTVPHLLRPFWPVLAVLVALEAARYLYDFRKFGKEAAYHMWSSKLWGLLLFTAAFAALVMHGGGWLLGVALGWGIIADLEGLAISVVLKRWQPDVPTFWHAMRIARDDGSRADSVRSGNA